VALGARNRHARASGQRTELVLYAARRKHFQATVGKRTDQCAAFVIGIQDFGISFSGSMNGLGTTVA